jgi:hypothetical protein
MDFLVQGFEYSGPMDRYKFDRKLIPSFSKQPLANGFKSSHPISDHQEYGTLPYGQSPSDSDPSSGMSSGLDAPNDATVLKFISQMLMEEEDLENKPCMFQDCLALQAAEKTFYDVLGQKYPPSLENQHLLDQNADSPIDSFTRPSSSHSSNSSSAADNFIESNWFRDQYKFESSFTPSSHVDHDSFSHSFGSSNNFSDAVFRPVVESLVTPPHFRVSLGTESQIFSQFGSRDSKFGQNFEYKDRNGDAELNERDHSPDGPRGKKNHDREDRDDVEGEHSSKQLASYLEESNVESDMDKVLLCPALNPHLHDFAECPFRHHDSKLPDDGALKNVKSKRSHGGRPRGKKRSDKKEMVDLRTLLTQCAQAVSSNDTRTANELLDRIRQHSSPRGDGVERLAHFFANALATRLAGAGTALYTAFPSAGISTADVLKGYQVYIKACPFKLLSNYFANRSISKILEKVTRVHIIDFGILYGFQWPCLIQRLSVRPGGPPKLRITGIELPQPGFRPAERVEETGRRLEKYCKRFGVPFEYHAIAKKLETIQLEDFKVDKDEVLVVNCLYRLRNVPDDTVVVSSPRDKVLKLIKSLNPDLFVHGVLNGTYNAPFFVTRFKEALFHFSALFDMFDATVSREDQSRMMYEKELFGRDVMNVVACEGTERVERPETYKQWQVRNVRAGFRQLPLDREIMELVKGYVERDHNKDFVVDEDGHWMLQGWKGRIIYAISCWKPAKEF